MDESGDGVAKLGFVVANAVATDYDASGFNHFGQSAGENVFQNFEVSFLGKTHQCQRSNRASAHGVDIAQRVGGGDLAENVGIIHDWREEIDGLHQSLIGRDLIHSGVVGVIKA